MNRIELRMAQALTAKAIDKAHTEYQQRPVCAAVCDVEGFLIAFARADGAPVRSIEIAQGKAYTAARMGVSTTAFLERLQRKQLQPGYYCDPRLTGLPGGSVLKNADGNIIGAIGVSGLTSKEDQAIADSMAEFVVETQ